jgi:2Fe-2S ferredoxin
MARIIFVEHDGARHEVDAAEGRSLMEAALQHNVPGIDADCGGACSCATCHVYVDDSWLERIGDRGDMEDLMLEYAERVRPNSRLSCQINVTDALDGLIVALPSSQR